MQKIMLLFHHLHIQHLVPILLYKVQIQHKIIVKFMYYYSETC